MAVKIDIQNTKIPIEMGNLKFEFDMKDSSVKELRKRFGELQKEAGKYLDVEEDDLSDEEFDKLTEDAEAFAKNTYDYLLGDGAFEQIYELSPSVHIMTGYLMQIIAGISVEMSKRSGLGASQKYMPKAKK